MKHKGQHGSPRKAFGKNPPPPKATLKKPAPVTGKTSVGIVRSDQQG